MAIGVIVGFIFFAIVAIAIGVVIFNAAKAEKSHSGIDIDKSKKINKIMIPLACVAIIGFAVVPSSIHTVNAGEIAVVKTMGKISGTHTAGTYFDLWLTREYDIYDAKVQQLTISTDAYTNDQQSMEIDLKVQFQIQKDHVIEIAENYGGLELLADRIEAVSIEQMKSVLAGFNAEKIIGERATMSPKVENAIREAISNKFYVDFNAAVLTDITFSEAFEKAVEEKMTAEQEKLKAAYENEKKIAQAEAELEIAKTEAEAKIQQAMADAESQRLIAQAQADAVKAKSIEVARMLGFTITETTVGDKTEYYIDFTGKSDAEIKLISDYIKYADYLDTWDGKLPDTLVTDGSTSIILPSV